MCDQTGRWPVFFITQADNHMNNYYWIGLKAVPGIGNVTFRRLLEVFDTPEAVMNAPADELAVVKGVSPVIATAITGGAWRRFADEESARLEQSDSTLVTFVSADYPKALFETHDPPPFLYVRGRLRGSEPAIAVVGSRKATATGLTVTGRFAAALARNGVAIVSGLARGIDTAAHQGAIQAEGRTIAVLGSGVDTVYPPENRKLFEQLAETGAVVSEFSLGTLPLAENFPRRNRIISGLSQGVLVVEAAENSGSLITARYALEQGREVFAVPGSIAAASCRGSNRLIKQGAKLVDCVEDILEEFPAWTSGMSGDSTEGTGTSFSLTPKEAVIYELLAHSPRHIDDIISQTELTAGEVSSMLLHLELKGAIVPLPGKHYAVMGR